eukprot:g9505.t1
MVHTMQTTLQTTLSQNVEAALSYHSALEADVDGDKVAVKHLLENNKSPAAGLFDVPSGQESVSAAVPMEVRKDKFKTNMWGLGGPAAQLCKEGFVAAGNADAATGAPSAANTNGGIRFEMSEGIREFNIAFVVGKASSSANEATNVGIVLETEQTDGSEKKYKFLIDGPLSSSSGAGPLCLGGDWEENSASVCADTSAAPAMMGSSGDAWTLMQFYLETSNSVGADLPNANGVGTVKIEYALLKKGKMMDKKRSSWTAPPGSTSVPDAYGVWNSVLGAPNSRENLAGAAKVTSITIVPGRSSVYIPATRC